MVEDCIEIFDDPAVKRSSIEITNALNTMQNLCLSHEVGNDTLELLQRFESFHVRDAARIQSNILTYLNQKKKTITVKISIYFFSSIAFKCYQSQYRSKYNIRFTQRLIEGTNFLIFRYLEHWLSPTFLLVPWEFKIADVHCIYKCITT